MSEWQSRPINEVGSIFDGPHATPERIDAGPYFLNIASLDNGRLNLANSDHVSEEDFARWTKRVTPRGGDLLFSYETRLGEAALMPDDVRACLGRRMALIRPDRTVIHPRFLLYLYLSPEMRGIVELNTIHGATVNRIPLNRMGSWKVRVPPLGEQQAIAEVLGALDDKIAANTKAAHTSEHLLRTEMDSEWLRRPGREISLSDLVELNPSTPKPTDSLALYVDMKKLPETGWSIDVPDRREAKGGARFLRGDTLLARITPCLENRKTGYVDNIDEGAIAIGSTEFIVVRARTAIAAPIAFLLVTETRFREFAIQNMVGTSGRQRVSAADLARFELPEPDPVWLADFGQRAVALFTHVESLESENRALAATRDALLPQLMSGKLRVRDAEAAASASGASAPIQNRETT